MVKQWLRPSVLLFLVVIFIASCGETPVADEAVGTTAVEPTVVEPTAVPAPTATLELNLPEITAVTSNHSELPLYGALEMLVTLNAAYTNPYDAREITLDGIFTAPDGTEMKIPGFWDGKDAWLVRFTPSQVGQWAYQLTVTDTNGVSQPVSGTFTTIEPIDPAATDPVATDPMAHGWLQPGSAVNPDYSGHYLVHHDGTPFYGLGHADALNILIDGFNIDRGVGLFDNMVEAGENYVVWWPLYSGSPLKNSYDNYSFADMKVIDTVVRDAQENGIFLIFTIWDHPQLRDETHDWGAGNWATNGFSELTDLKSFFTDEEAWAWQENFYRYVIARWGYSPAIGMWQTVSEINGTNAYDQTDTWHEKVNAYFIENDPYRHPTTASKSGDVAWEAGHLAMDAPQVHIYDFNNEAGEIDVVAAADVLAYWTSQMWNIGEKPNWVGEFGVPGNDYYPELYHNAIWAALASGAAMTPAEWNSGGSWMRMSEAMLADLARLGQFVADMPLAEINPSALQLESSDEAVRGWGLAGQDGGLIWLQDFSLEGKSIEEVRADETVRQDVELTVNGMAAGTYQIQPYDTWLGEYLEPFSVECIEEQPCLISVPAFQADIALKIEQQ